MKKIVCRCHDVTEEDIDTMHPDDKLAIFTAIYMSGRKGILSEKFLEQQRKRAAFDYKDSGLQEGTERRVRAGTL